MRTETPEQLREWAESIYERATTPGEAVIMPLFDFAESWSRDRARAEQAEELLAGRETLRQQAEFRAEKAERERDAALARERRLREALYHTFDKWLQDANPNECLDTLELVESALADAPEPSASGGWPTAPIRDKPWYSVYQPEPSGYELGPAPGSVERAWQSNEEGRRRAEALKLKPNETSELRQSLKHAKDSIAQWPEGKLQGIKRPQMAFRTPAGTEPPPDLAPAQMVEFDDGSIVRADRCDWRWLRDHEWEYSPYADLDGLPYVSGEGLEPGTKYVATDANDYCYQYDMRPDQCKAWWSPSDSWSGNRFAPATHAIPGDWRQSLAKVWREEG